MLERVYRLQNSRGVGPYRHYGGNYDAAWAGKEHTQRHRPTPWSDNVIIEDYEVCAFTTYKGLCRWFTARDREKLYRLGFRVVSALVDDSQIKRGRYQCVVPGDTKWYPVIMEQ
jgi:hypothetical protein